MLPTCGAVIAPSVPIVTNEFFIVLPKVPLNNAIALFVDDAAPNASPPPPVASI